MAVKRRIAHFAYGTHKIPYSLWMHGEPAQIDTVVFLGTAQTGLITKWVAAMAPAGVIVADGLPHWKADPSGSDLKTFSHAYTAAAYGEALKLTGKRFLHLVGISQGAPGTVWLAQHSPDAVGNIALAMPLGLTIGSFGHTSKERMRELKKRAGRAVIAGKKSWHLGRAAYSTYALLRARFAEAERGASDNKYAAGLAYDLRPDCKQVFEQRQKRNHIFIIFLGEKDVIFPPGEVKTSLAEAGLSHIPTVVLPHIGHPSFVAADDARALAAIIAEVRT